MEHSTVDAQPEVIQLSKNGWMPNNERLPVLLYHGATSIEGPDPAALFEAQFQRNGWPPQWRDGVYDFHHYHSTAHEVRGLAGGGAKLMLGGENGHVLEVHAGDVVALPTGTGHCNWRQARIFWWWVPTRRISIGTSAAGRLLKKLSIPCATCRFPNRTRLQGAQDH